MSLSRAQLDRMAKLLDVDEVTEFPVLGRACRLMIRVGDLCQMVEVFDDDVRVERRIDHVMREITGTVRDLKNRVAQAGRRAALQEFIGSARVVELAPMDLSVSKLIDQPLSEDPPRLSRFEAVAQELETM